MKTSRITKTLVATMLLAMMASAALASAPTLALLSPTQLTVKGSSTVYPISLLAESDFEYFLDSMGSPYADVDCLPDTGGSGVGIGAWQSLTVDMAASSEMPISDPTASNDIFSATYPYKNINDPQAFALGRDGVALMVPSTNTWITDIDTETVVKIYTGQYTNWQDIPGLVGAPDQEILPIGRILSSGTFDGFKSFFLKAYGFDKQDLVGTYRADATNAQVLDDIQSGNFPYAIAFIGLGFVENEPAGVTPLNLYNPTLGQFIEPKIANVNAGTYVSDGPEFSSPKVVARWLWYFMDGIPAADSLDAVKSLWISFVKSDPAYVSENGYITMSLADMAGNPADNPSAAAGTQTLPDTYVNHLDVNYFVQAYIQYNAAETGTGPLNPYANLNIDLAIDHYDINRFVQAYVQALS
jgi:ABC-type phosphate transport system substrate-binding protein